MSAESRRTRALNPGAHDYPARPAPAHGWSSLGAGSDRRATEFIGAETHTWQWGHIRVLSSAEIAEYQGESCMQNHVSVSVDERLFRRATDDELAYVRHVFDMDDAEEDNHQPGRIRNLFLPLHLPRGTVGVCDCKSDEMVVVEPDGFTWSKAAH